MTDLGQTVWRRRAVCEETREHFSNVWDLLLLFLLFFILTFYDHCIFFSMKKKSQGQKKLPAYFKRNCVNDQIANMISTARRMASTSKHAQLPVSTLPNTSDVVTPAPPQLANRDLISMPQQTQQQCPVPNICSSLPVSDKATMTPVAEQDQLLYQQLNRLY